MEVVKALCLLLSAVLCCYNTTKSSLYEKHSLKKSIFTGFLWSMAIMAIGVVLISFQNWFATGLLFFMTLVIWVSFHGIYTKGDEHFVEAEKLAEEQKKKREQAKADKKNTKVAAVTKPAVTVKPGKADKPKPAEHGPVFKNNRHQKRAKARSYTPNELRQIAFTYIDYNGNTTYREVAVNRFDGWKINGHCLDKNANRTFKIYSILSDITLRETGELLKPDEWAELWKMKSLPH